MAGLINKYKQEHQGQFGHVGICPNGHLGILCNFDISPYIVKLKKYVKPQGTKTYLGKIASYIDK